MSRSRSFSCPDYPEIMLTAMQMRAYEILRAAEVEGLRLSEICADMNLAQKHTGMILMVRLLSRLIEAGIVTRVSRGRYCVKVFTKDTA